MNLLNRAVYTLVKLKKKALLLLRLNKYIVGSLIEIEGHNLLKKDL